MLKLKEIKMGDIPKRSRPGYGCRQMIVDEFVKSGMKACEVERGNDENTSVRTIVNSLRSAAYRLGVSDTISIYMRKGKVYIIKKEGGEKKDEKENTV